MPESLYFVRAAMKADKVPEVLAQLKSSGIAEIKAAYHIYDGILTSSHLGHRTDGDGIELVIKATVDHNRFAEILRRIVPDATLYIGTNLLETVVADTGVK